MDQINYQGNRTALIVAFNENQIPDKFDERLSPDILSLETEKEPIETSELYNYQRTQRKKFFP